MASDASFVEYVCEQADLRPRLTHKKMFGEYALYLDGTVVAFVCDNQLFIKPTEAGRALLVHTDEQPPYPRGKPHFRLGAELDDRDLLRRVLLATQQALPASKPLSTRRKGRL